MEGCNWLCTFSYPSFNPNQMKKFYFLKIFWLLSFLASSQSLQLDTNFPAADKPLTITVNVEGTSLEGYIDKVWIWTWIDNAASDADAPTNVNPATSPGQDAALMTRSSTNPDKYSITITPTIFFNKSAGEIKRIGLKLKSRDWADGKQSDQDLFIDMYEGGFQLKLVSPANKSSLIKNNESLSISAVSSTQSDKIELFLDGVLTYSTSNTDTLKYTFTASSGGTFLGKLVATKAGETLAVQEFTITVIQPTIEEVRPAAVIEGINYIDDQTVILSLLAPGKDFVFVLGEFNNWEANSTYQMKRDGEKFWLEITGLTPGVEYAFQYFVDGKVKVADPFSDKILDPDDQNIPPNSYPNPKAFPSGADSGEWYEKRASVLQTGQSAYQWEIDDFNEPAKEELIIYELLIRDFFASGDRNYQSLIDTLSYLKKLGVNAIELMPVTEFNGNDSWGYNPAFMFAVDKAYGTKEMLKKFIDEAHKQGFAVILDIVLNHQDIPNPYVLMNWDGSGPTVDNPWFNRIAKHPFNVFFDMNHEITYTQDFADTVCHYWLNEYKFDGLRFDLSKGFTQKENLNNQAGWDAYDESRIGILKRMAAKIFSYKPEAYLILEHFGSAEEEKELSDAGMMLWGNMHGVYKDAALGKDTNFSRTYYKARNWVNNNLVTYMESHDEERLMIEALANGMSSGSYNIKKLSTALDRMKLVSSFHFLVPGAKMVWQFGELGYDYSINTCPDGSIKPDCRVSAKPVKWDYLAQQERAKLNKVYSKLFELRKTEAFREGEFEWSPAGLQKRISISHTSMDILLFGNFATTEASYAPKFPAKGWWYDYLSGDSIDVQETDKAFTLKPGEFHIYTNKRITLTDEDLVPFKSQIVLNTENTGVENISTVYPNPNKGSVVITNVERIREINIYDLSGKSVKTHIVQENGQFKVNFQQAPKGVYVMEIKSRRETRKLKIVKEE